MRGGDYREVAEGQEFGKLFESVNGSYTHWRFRPLGIAIDRPNGHAERKGAARDLGADGPEPDDSQRGLGQKDGGAVHRVDVARSDRIVHPRGFTSDWLVAMF